MKCPLKMVMHCIIIDLNTGLGNRSHLKHEDCLYWISKPFFSPSGYFTINEYGIIIENKAVLSCNMIAVSRTPQRDISVIITVNGGPRLVKLTFPNVCQVYCSSTPWYTMLVPC